MGDTENNIQMYIGKVDATKYDSNLRNLDVVDNDLKFTAIYKKGKYIEEIEDIPNKKQPENKEHEVLYTVVVYTKDGLVSSNQIKYSQNDIGLSTAEVILIVLSLLCYLAAAFFIWRGIENWRQLRGANIEDKIKKGNLDRLLE